MNIDRLNLWDQAQVAHSTANWSLLLECLQQLIEAADDRAKVRKGDSTTLFLTSDNQSDMLNWAMDILEFGDFDQRWNIAKLFPKLGSSAIAPLIEVVSDEEVDEELFWFSVRILAKFDRPDVINFLIELLKSSDESEKAIASQALSEIGASAVAAITELLACVDTRLLAVRSLCYIRHSETITPLLGVTQDPQVEIRAAAIEALSSFHDARIPPVLLNALNDIAASVRREAVIGLSFRTDLQAELNLVDRLLPLLYDFNLKVCQATAIALGRIGTDKAAEGLFKVLNSASTPVTLQIEIVRALGRIETQIGLEYLRSTLLSQITPGVWQEAESGGKNSVGVPPTHPDAGFYNGGNPQGRHARLFKTIVEVLGQIEQASLKPLAAQILIELLQSNDQMIASSSIKQAIMSLGQLGSTAAIDPLIQLLAEQDPAVRLHAIAALKQIDAEVAYHKIRQMSSDTTLTPQIKQGVAIALQEWFIDVGN